ncbi:sensor histidine kinase [Bacteroides nordii]|mgnify:FL=1|uniref:histidine kinase n=1 Tax=Bacteroides nordii TaxID=291645 RepID=A0A413VJZ8_9BACE|nr:HAMP domain-containing sensor histidine kinase [Bacteroides nordii]RHB33903.1 sensor histidine kinase [Bacteroides nordii]
MSYLRCIICILLCCLRTNVSLAQSFQENKPGIPLMSAQVIREDSLKSLLNQTTNPHKRIDLLLNLKDISEGNGIETQYTRQLFEEGKKTKDPYAIFVAVTHMVTKYANQQEKSDSLHNYYIKTLEEIEKGTPAEGAATFFKMNIYHRLIGVTTDKQERTEFFRQIRKEFKARQATEDKYQKVKRLFLEGLMQLWELNDQGKSKIYVPEIPLWEEAWNTAQDFPGEYVRRYYLGSIHSLLSGAYNQQQDYENQKRITWQVIDECKAYYKLSEEVYPRPFLYKDNTYVRYYTQLIRGAMYISDEEAYKIYNLFRQHMLSAQEEFLDRNKIYLFETAYLFLGNMHRVDEALANCDSLIHMIETNHAPGFTRVLETYKNKAYLFRRANRPEDACIAYERAMQVSDSLIKKEYVERVEALRLKNDIDKLKLEKTVLTAQNRLVEFIFTICILIVVVSISMYYYKSLKKTRKLQKEIYRQSIKAQESEQMKSAFINSICHEIRTPLNSINGFSEILIDESTPTEDKKEYQNIIQENTRILTSLLDSLIEVANLDSLTEALPLEDIEVTSICRTEMEYLQETEGKEGIQYLLDLPVKECIAHTHAQYLSLLLRSLLNNANKFTQEGSICLSCSCNKENKKIIINVTDTGCGISADKHEYVFQRFTKLNTFTLGNGLGLYLCRLIARHMNGNIKIDPNWSKGSKFIFTIPMGNNQTE